jgi:RNA recognition motif-containing protein
MREKDEREWVEKKGKRKGYVQRLDQASTSFFFTNIPDDVKAVDLWPKFAHFGRVGEVYIPEKRDKQGSRFGFVKYRDVRDAREQLDLISDIWVGTYKIRVNIARFGKGAPAKENMTEGKGKAKEVETRDIWVERRAVEGRSFKDALVVGPKDGSSGSTLRVDKNGGEASGEVEWEVEVETEALSRLKGAFIGFLTV